MYAVLLWFSNNDQRNTSGMVYHPTGPVAAMTEEINVYITSVH